MSFSLAAKRALAPSMVVFTRGFFALCLSLLMSCGGGGGGGDDDDNGGGNFRVTLDRSSVSWTFYAGADVPAAQNITGTATGTFNGQLFVAAIVENNGAVNAINPNIFISLSGTQATASLQPVAGLAAGTYTGRILFLACSDAACNNRIGGTPLPVTFTVTVQAAVQATPGTITRSVESGNTVVSDIVVVPGVNETGFTIGATSAFVQITNQTAGGFRVTLPSLPVGVYNASIPLTGSNGSRSSVPITYTVTAPPGGEKPLSISTHSVTLTAPEGASSQPPRPQVEVTEATWRPGLQPPIIEYREEQGWLNVTPVAGGFEFAANGANLSTGTYTANVGFAGNPLPQGIEDPFRTFEQVFVSLTVGPGLVRPADVVRVIDSQTRDFELNGSVDIDLAGGPAVTWNATSDVPWLFVTPSGMTGSDLSYEIQPLFLSTAENFAEHVATVTITAPGTVITPMSFPIRVQRRLAEVTGVGAHIQLSGQQTTLVVSGRGFGAFADGNIRVVSNAGSATSVQRVSDTKVLMTYDSLSEGSYRMFANNALGFDTATGTFVVVPPTSYAYSAVPSGGGIIRLAVDYETDTLYGVRLAIGAATDQGTLVRFRPNGGTWTVDSPALSAVYNVGVLLDGNVIVNTVPGGLTILDRDTLNSTFTLDVGCTGIQFRSQNMPVTLDGRVWLSQARINGPDCSGFPLWGEPGWFDPATQSFELLEVPQEPWYVRRFANGPSFVMSRNGERLVMHQESNQNFPTLVYLDASESVLRPVPSDNPDAHQFFTASASDDGSRILLEKDRLLDEQFATIGRVSIPPYVLPLSHPAFKAAAVLSPDGSRAYVLTHPSYFVGEPTTPASPLPRVWVLDTTGDVGDAPLPVLGYFELADHPSCLNDGDVCRISPAAAISLDGDTLFFVGDQLLVVAPIPSVLNTSVVVGPNGRMQTKAKPWRLPQH
jgi:hypothetical protein